MLRKPAERFVSAVLAHGRWVVAAIVLVSIVAGYFATKIRFENSVEIWFNEDDQNWTVYRDYVERFESDQFAFVAIAADDVFAPDVLGFIAQLTEAFTDVPHAGRVRSIQNVGIPVADGGAVFIDPLYEGTPTLAEAALIRERALNSRLLTGNLVAASGQTTGILIEVDPNKTDFDSRKAFIRGVQDIVERHSRPDLEIRVAGGPVFDSAMGRYSERDYKTTAPAMLLFIVVIAWLVYRRMSAIGMLVGVVVLALLWIFGLMGALGIDINILSIALLPLIVAVGIADTVHVLSEYVQELAKGKPAEAAARDSAIEVLQPCFFTSATTMAGFLSLLVSDLAPVREFGWLASLGVASAFVISLTLVPITLHRTKPALVRAQPRKTPVGWMLEHLGRPTPGSSAGVLVATLLLTAGAAYALTFLEVGANFLTYFKQDDPVRVDAEWVDQRMGGTTSFEILAKTEPEGLKDPTLLAEIDNLGRELTELSFVSRTMSVTDLLREVHRAFKPDADGLPERSDLVAQYYVLLEGEEDFTQIVQDEYSIARITVRTNVTRAGEFVKGLTALEQRVDAVSDGRISFTITGQSRLWAQMETYLMRTQLHSFTIAFVVVSLLMFLLLRSIRFGLFAMIPNLVPILLGMGMMSIAGIALAVGTVMIACIALGIIVDDSIHFLYRLRENESQGHSIETSIERTMQQTGRPIILTSIILVVGFSVLTLGSFNPNINFGFVSAMVMFFAVIADLVVLPAALIVLRRRH